MRPDEAPAASPSRAQPVAVPAAVSERRLDPAQRRAAGRLVNPALRPVPQLIWSVDLGARRRQAAAAPDRADRRRRARLRDGRRRAADRGDARRGRSPGPRSLVPAGQVPDAGPGGGIAASGGVLYVTTGFGEVFALDPRSGGTIWQETLEAPIRAAPTVQDGRVFVGAARRHRLRARRAERRHALAGAGRRRRRAARRRQPGGGRASSRCCPSPRARCSACWRATG